jgi:hypothetical protein
MGKSDRIMSLPTKECRQARHDECSDPDNCTCYCHKMDKEESMERRSMNAIFHSI